MEIGQWVVLSLVSFILFLLFTYLTQINTADSAPASYGDISDWFWWSTMSIKKSIYYSLSMVFFFLSLGFSICGIIEGRKKIEHMRI